MTLSGTWTHIKADIRAFAQDAARWKEQRSGMREALSAASTPSVSCIIAFRIAHYLYVHDFIRTAGIVATLNYLLFRVHIHPACVIGPGLLIPHPGAVLLQANAGRSLRLSAGCTVCGDRAVSFFSRQPPGFPTLGDRCTIGARARVLGSIQVGHNAVVGFSAVALTDVGENATAMQPKFRNRGQPPARQASLRLTNVAGG